MIDVHQSYCDNRFMIDVSQIIMLYIFNLNGNVCQQKKQHLKFQSTVSPYSGVGGSLCSGILDVAFSVDTHYHLS